MKTIQSNLSIWALVALLSGSSLVACAQATSSGSTAATSDPAKAALLTPLQQSVTKLKKLASTGDPDFDYSFQAKIYTQGIQDLLKQEIQNGKNPDVVNMAKAMLSATDSDMTLIDGTMKQLKPTRPNQAYTQQQSRNVEAINLRLQQTGTSDKLTSDLDKNFTALLLDQRQDGIDMANTYLQYGKNTTLRDYAQKLVDKAKQEINTIKAQQPK
ncbi:DUF305 domain-containing protein [Spirosoma koreense]